MPSFTGTGTRAASFCSSAFSSSRTWMCLNSAEREKRRKSSMSLMAGLRYSL